MFNLNKALELTLTGGIDLLTGKPMGPDYGSLETYPDYDALEQGSRLSFRNLKNGIAEGTVVMVEENTGKEIVLKGEFTQRQQEILLCGGLLNYTKENS